MKKGLFFTYGKIDENAPDGIEKKILSEQVLFRERKIEMKLFPLKKEKGTYWNYCSKYSNYDFIYFRKSTTIDYRFIHFFRKLKKDNPGIVVFMEIPTFPYEGEYGNNFKARLLLIIDKMCRRHIWKYINRIVVVGNNLSEKLWKIKTINIVNGIDVDGINPIIRNDDKDDITIGCIAKFSPWHGYERLILGLHRYYQLGGNKKIKILMVGDGGETAYYKSLVKEMQLEKQVSFTGKLTGDELQCIYDKIDIGCCSLGRYKSGHDNIGDLKSREFLAKGLPMITGCEIDIIKEKEFKYFIEFPNDPSLIDINEVVCFYERIRQETTPIEMQNQIREYATKYADIHNTFSKVLVGAEELLGIY